MRCCWRGAPASGTAPSGASARLARRGRAATLTAIPPAIAALRSLAPPSARSRCVPAMTGCRTWTRSPNAPSSCSAIFSGYVSGCLGRKSVARKQRARPHRRAKAKTKAKTALARRSPEATLAELNAFPRDQRSLFVLLGAEFGSGHLHRRRRRRGARPAGGDARAVGARAAGCARQGQLIEALVPRRRWPAARQRRCRRHPHGAARLREGHQGAGGLRRAGERAQFGIVPGLDAGAAGERFQAIVLYLEKTLDLSLRILGVFCSVCAHCRSAYRQRRRGHDHRDGPQTVRRAQARTRAAVGCDLRAARGG